MAWVAALTAGFGVFIPAILGVVWLAENVHVGWAALTVPAVIAFGGTWFVVGNLTEKLLRP